ncbi:unnamed protein product [Cyprideis torosa]|uniref:Uncharacterized protein n=1 Tax=Cyprideis torosa TaxID=163714 RepID=A0A7R8ZM62_9CRUS|nr:unnamed protein product [Cyprideis torosa]CAG0893473.1 unnamed protein product [Cyprideis torosa]
MMSQHFDEIFESLLHWKPEDGLVADISSKQGGFTYDPMRAMVGSSLWSPEELPDLNLPLSTEIPSVPCPRETLLPSVPFGGAKSQNDLKIQRKVEKPAVLESSQKADGGLSLKQEEINSTIAESQTGDNEKDFHPRTGRKRKDIEGETEKPKPGRKRRQPSQPSLDESDSCSSVSFRSRNDSTGSSSVPSQEEDNGEFEVVTKRKKKKDKKAVVLKVPGVEVDPAQLAFSEDDLKPQPIYKKSSKKYIPETEKDEEYWSRREKNNIAAKRSREARRAKENQIVMRAAYLEKENAAFKEQVARLQAENEVLQKELLKRMSLEEVEALKGRP